MFDLHPASPLSYNENIQRNFTYTCSILSFRALPVLAGNLVWPILAAELAPIFAQKPVALPTWCIFAIPSRQADKIVQIYVLHKMYQENLPAFSFKENAILLHLKFLDSLRWFSCFHFKSPMQIPV